jgi:hypothetical protein
MALSGAAPLRVQAAAAASLLADGVLPEDVGAAAGLANPAGGEYTPGVLADLADAIRRAAVSAAGALELDGASDATADAAWAEGDESVDYRDSENAPWWDPEALATLLCATHVADGAPGALRASDQAVMARRFVESHGWSTKDVGDLLWCIHTAQHTDTTAHASRGGNRGTSSPWRAWRNSRTSRCVCPGTEETLTTNRRKTRFQTPPRSIRGRARRRALCSRARCRRRTGTPGTG